VMVRVGGDVTADKADGNYKDQLVNLHGNVVIHDTSGQYSAHQRGQQSSPSTLTCDDAIVDGKGKIYTATGNVHYVSADTNVTSDSGTLSELTHDLFLTGNVHMAQGPRSVVADKVHFNTLTGIAMASSDTKKGVVMLVPGQFSRGLATPKPLHVPKNPVSKPVPSSAP
jgi:lipopolysaccharide assembly outer membrane protein LptD (OstA)